MCEILEQMRNEAMKKGVQQGMEKGMQQKLLDNIRSLMETLQLSASQAMHALKVPKAEQARYLTML